jgi:hypothetical protein
MQHKERDVNEEQDTLAIYEDAVIETFKNDRKFQEKLKQHGVPWKGVQEQLKASLPEVLSDRDNIAFHLVPKAMKAVFGEQEIGWKTEKRDSKSGSAYTTWIVVLQ